MTVFYDIPTFL